MNAGMLFVQLAGGGYFALRRDDAERGLCDRLLHGYEVTTLSMMAARQAVALATTPPIGQA